MATFLLEIRTEEIPANALAGARTQLQEGLDQRLREAGYDKTTTIALSTSRRLVATVAGLPLRQADHSEQLTGPPVRVAFQADGSPTKAAEGFARKVGLPLDQLQRLTTDKGEYLSATVVHTGRATAEILAELVPAVVNGLRFPKMMRWGNGDQLFVRPVHGVLALLDEQVVPVELFGITSDRCTTGHRVHQPEQLELSFAADYVAELRRRDVLVDPAERRQRLTEQATELVTAVGCTVVPDEQLVAEHVELVEYPGLLLGEIDAQYLELPREVVIMTLRHHQKCLVLQHEDGSLAPYFLAIVDRKDDPEGLVKQGNEWVIGARLADARFFFDEDRKQPLAALVPQLQRVELHQKLGTLAAKVERIRALAAALGEPPGEPLDSALRERAAALVKADLVSNMVGEFPELQGVMGGHYLRLEHEPEALWTAARDHYQPSGFDGEVPGSGLGCLLGVADRLDTIAGLFAVDEIPSGSRDPFGLRRAAQGVVRIVAERDWGVDLQAAITAAVQQHRQWCVREVTEVVAEVEAFMADRVRRYLTELGGVAPDTADAVMAAGWAVIPDLAARAAALERIRATASFRSLALAFKRVRNITADQAAGAVDPALLVEPAEQALHRAAQELHTTLARLLPQRRLDDAFHAMAGLAEVLDQLFEQVLVMADDTNIRSNRIALLRSLGQDFLKLADLSKLQVEGGSS